ncbi:hypothetical protein [Burkholderia sp. BCC1993]|uniref:hypothetical protein n=1 Tax=Burkholderia sp. BCC1993 TaxID=2817444 RepID=UPI002AB20980|nr:hypothetical protein [Burkholderia sp. BCC1993]
MQNHRVRIAAALAAFLVASLFSGLLLAGVRFSSAVLLTGFPGILAVHVVVWRLVGVDLFRAVLRRYGGNQRGQSNET